MWFCRIFLAVQTESLTHWLGHFLFWKMRYETTNKWPIKRDFKFKKMANAKTNTKPWQKYGLWFLISGENGRRWAPAECSDVQLPHSSASFVHPVLKILSKGRLCCSASLWNSNYFSDSWGFSPWSDPSSTCKLGRIPLRLPPTCSQTFPPFHVRCGDMTRERMVLSRC